jgi:hypothetical protein
MTAGTDRVYDASERRAFAQLYRVMVEPSRVHIVTHAATGRRWITDTYVMLDVTDFAAIVGSDHADGRYSLLVTVGLRWIDSTVPDVEGYFAHVEHSAAEWMPMHETEWSLRADAARLLWGADRQGGCHPAAINAKALEALRAVYVAAEDDIELVIERDASRPAGLSLRVRLAEMWEPASRTVGYVMGVRIPDSAMDAALYIASSQTERQLNDHRNNV